MTTKRNLYKVVGIVLILCLAMSIATAGPNPPAKSKNKLTAEISVSPKDPSVGRPVTFKADDVSGGVPPYTYAWLTGDGQSGTGKTIVFTFLTAGLNNITLNVTDSMSTMVTVVKNITVKPAPPLKAEIEVSPKDPSVGRPVTFKADDVSGGVPPYTYAWLTGDGQSGTGKTIAFTFLTAGLNNITLNVTDSMSTMVTVVKNITVKPAPPLKAEIEVSPKDPSVGRPVTFKADDVSGGVPPYTYAWLTGDGQSGTGKTIAFTFLTAGLNNITLNVTDSMSTMVTVVKNITVKPAPPLKAEIEVSPKEPRVGQLVTFEADDVCGGVPPYTYEWVSNGFPTVTTETATYTFLTAGPVTVTLNVTDSMSSTVTVVKNIIVKSPPPLKAEIEVSPKEPRVGQVVSFEADDVCGGVPPYTYAWATSDSQASTVKDPTFIFPTAGPVTVTLTVTDSMSNTVVVVKNIIVKPAHLH